MAAKNYQLNITKSDGTSETVSFAVPDTAGTYKLKFTLSNGEEIDAGNITVDDAEHSYSLKLTLSDGSTIDAGTIVTPIVIPTFGNMSWAEIAAVSEAGNASTTFAVGDEKTITLSTGEEITLVILGFDHDDLSDGSGKAGMTIGMKNLLSKSYRWNATFTDWGECEMRIETLQTLLSQLPSDLQAIIKTVDKKYVAKDFESISTSNDKLFIFSIVEVGDTPPYTAQQLYEQEGEIYDYWIGSTEEDRIKYASNGNGSKRSWWLRSVSNSIANFEYTIYQISSYSNGRTASSMAKYTEGVCFGFCV